MLDTVRKRTEAVPISTLQIRRYVEEKVDGANLGISIHNNQIHLKSRVTTPQASKYQSNSS